MQSSVYIAACEELGTMINVELISDFEVSCPKTGGQTGSYSPEKTNVGIVEETALKYVGEGNSGRYVLYNASSNPGVINDL